MNKIKLILGASILLLSVQANADITSVDDSVFGIDSVTRDSVSGLDWLDITFTVNRSVADVSGQLGVGGEFEGWRYATGIEFEELLFNYTGVDSAPVYQTEEYTEGSDSIDEFIKLLGDSVEAYNEFNGLPPSDELYCGTEPECIGQGYHETHGYLADETPPEFTQLFYTGIIRDLGESHSSNDYSLSHYIRVHQANQHPAVGSYLVRVFPTPPTTLINGSFEEPFGIGTYVHRNDDELPGWTLFSTYRGTVHFDTDYAPVSEGSQAVQIEVPGDWISQSIATIIGHEYRVSFDLSAYPVYGGPNLGYTPCNPYCDSILGVSVGSASEVFNGNSEEYVTHTLMFTADSAISTLKFENLFIVDNNDEWGNYPHLDNVSVTPVSTHVTIDIKPGSDPNSINPRSNGVIPVAVLGSMDFDAMQVDFSTVTFGPDGASSAHDGHVEDANDDGYMDMVFHFKTQETGIVCGDTEATLMGKTSDGASITGTDTVNTVGCKGTSAEKVDSSTSASAVSWMLLLGLGVLGLWRVNRRTIRPD